MANTYSDGSILFGTQDVTIGGTVFTADDIDVQDGSRSFDANKGDGSPNKKAHVRTKLTGSLTLQFPTTTTPPPLRFAAVTLLRDGDLSPQSFIITSVGTKNTNEGEAKISVSLEEKL